MNENANNNHLPNLRDILLYSPHDGDTKYLFDRNNSVFYDKFFIITNEYLNLANKILNDVESPSNIRFLHGFPGTGKTTFVRWLKFTVEERNLKIFDHCTDATVIESLKDNISKRNNDTFISYINFGYPNSPEANPVKDFFINQLTSKTLADYQETIRFIADWTTKNPNKDIEDFEVFYDLDGFETLGRADCNDRGAMREKRKQLIDSNVSDETIIFFFLFHKARLARAQGKKSSLCLIDNLDALNSFQKYYSFWQSFVTAYLKYLNISLRLKNDLIDRDNLKIIFTLRNYNLGRIYNQIHVVGKIKDKFYGKNYRLIFDDGNTENLKTLLNKRLNYYTAPEETNSQTSKSETSTTDKSNVGRQQKTDDYETCKLDRSIAKLLDSIIKEDNSFRERVYLPLFNYNVRHFSQQIVTMVSDEDYYEFEKEKYDFLYSYSKNNPKNKDALDFKNGARGIILHNLIKTLFLTEGNYPVDQLIKDDSSYENVKFCSVVRVMLTTMYNLTYPNNPLNSVLDGMNNPTYDEYFDYSELIKALRLRDEGTDTILDLVDKSYDYLVGWIEKLHGINDESIIHFLNVRKVDVDTDEQGNTKFRNREDLLDAKDIPTNKLKSKLFMDMQINPSAIVYLRHLVCHFEFFSAHFHWNKTGGFNQKFKPLYLATNKNEISENFEFESLIEDVFKLVKIKKRVNDNLIREMLVRKNKFRDLKNLLKSDLIFKTAVKDDEGRIIAIKESLYSSRLITTHFTYIEQFRNFLNVNEEFKSKNSAQMIRINGFLLRYLEKYVNLYFNTDEYIKDPSIKETMEKLRNEVSKRRATESLAEKEEPIRIPEDS